MSSTKHINPYTVKDSVYIHNHDPSLNIVGIIQFSLSFGFMSEYSIFNCNHDNVDTVRTAGIKTRHVSVLDKGK